MSLFENSAQYALERDKNDELRDFRREFLFPQHDGKPVIYFTGNSLGLQPTSAKEAIEIELEDWAKYGVDGHFQARNPWFSYHEPFKSLLSPLVGAKDEEVTPMNGLTANIHFLMVSFYRPKGKRYKILCEAKAFPSDQYALESQVRFHGYDAAEAIIEVAPRAGEHLINEEDIYEILANRGDEIALVMIGGVNYYTGQLFDMKRITEAGQRAGAIVGFDLAHAAGNVALELHNWGVDFAAWCSYKYLNSGPGSVAGIFVHEKHGKNAKLNRFAGWWGNDPSTRFLMEKGFVPDVGADGWQLSNAPVFSMAVHKASLEIFKRAGMKRISAKRDQLTAYLEFVVSDVSDSTAGLDIEIITPADPSKRGAQLSLLTHGSGKGLFDALAANGVIADWREPNVIRIAPAPLYNSFADVHQFGVFLRKAVAE
ncbi:MAG: kynureninase [Vicingaceae bacterium]